MAEERVVRPSVPSTRAAPAVRRPWPSAAALERVAWWATWVFVAVMAVTVLWPDELVAAGVAISALLFAAGIVAFAVAYLRAVQRSRAEVVDLPGLFFLHRSAPKPTQRRMMVALVVQIAVGLTAASLRPFTPLAFGTLVPVFGLGAAALWGATHGTFPARRPPTDARNRGDGQRTPAVDGASAGASSRRRSTAPPAAGPTSAPRSASRRAAAPRQDKRGGQRDRAARPPRRGPPAGPDAAAPP